MRIQFFVLLLLPSLTFASFCPTNFRPISNNNSTQDVIALCGQPDKVVSKKVQVQGPQEWNYYVKQTVANNTTYQTQGTLKTSIAFGADGKVINISVNGIGVGGTSICGSYVQLGDTSKTIQSACGKPSTVNKETTSGQPQNDTITTFIYNTNPPKTLVFKNGLLINTP